MSQSLLLAVYDRTDQAAEAIAGLSDMGVRDADVTVMSSVPYEPQMLGRHAVNGRLTAITLLGVVAGLLLGLFLTVGIYELYPLMQGGQPLIPVAPSLIILFEVTMLGTMGTAFLAFLVLNRFPVFGRPAYDLRITEGKIGVLADVKSGQVSEAEEVLRQAGAVDDDVQTLESDRRPNRVSWLYFVGAVASVVAVVAVISLLFFYDVIRIPFPTQMAAQNSTAYLQGPRRAAPEAAVPVQGPVLIAGQPASEPVPASESSLQRGRILFGIDCALCHGQEGAGDGPLAKYFEPHPADLTAEDVQELPDDVLFLVLTQGRGIMPSLAENLSPVERWDVINHIHSLARNGSGG
ncbi:MAG: quinol:electron acceptor oxidoreductase subunit ActD [Anaerolineae bacterium]|jgi:mono/diheme cytochrome c family protein